MQKQSTIFSKNDTLIAKAVAILFMLIHHNFLGPERYAGYEVIFYPFTESMTNTVASYFKICVGFFVLLSAYGMTVSFKRAQQKTILDRATLEKMTVKRYVTLMMNYIFIFLSAHLISLIGGFSHNFVKVYGAGKMSVGYFIIDALGFADLFKTPTFNGTWWYMTLAIFIILFMPLIFKLYERFGFILLPLAYIAFKYTGVKNTPIIRYMPALILGIICAETNLFVRVKNLCIVKNHFYLNKTIKFVIECGLLASSVIIRQNPSCFTFVNIWDSLLPFIYICFSFEFLAEIPGLNAALKFIGKHSTNIFMFHTFIRLYFWGDFTYSFKYPILITLVLLAASLLFSMAFEFIKKITRYNKLSPIISEKICNFIDNISTQTA